MNLDKINSAGIQEACDKHREEHGEIDVDDELLAILIDGGIEAVPHESRAMILRAIGSQPEIAVVVASLAETSSKSFSLIQTVGPFKISRLTLIRSWAACALLAVVMTVWLLVAVSSQVDHGVQLLGSDVPKIADVSSANPFRITLLKITVGILWVTQCLFFIPLILNRKNQKVSIPDRVRR